MHLEREYIMKISIIIPTRERALYLPYALQTALAIPDPNIEIIVSDNASTDGTSDLLETFDDPRLIRLNTMRRVSMRENFQLALDHATGDYVIYIGDDDAVLPGQFAALRRILERDRPDSLSWEWLGYSWPADGGSRRTGRLTFDRQKFYGALSVVDLKPILGRLLAGAPPSGPVYPSLYHGVVSRDCLHRLTQSGSAFFMSKIPDVYFTYTALIANVRHMHVQHAFTLNGTSPASTGAAYKKSTDETNDGPASRFQREALIDPVQDAVTIGASIPAAFLETLETALAIRPAEGLKPDYPAWYRYILNNARQISESNRTEISRNLAAHAQTYDLVDELWRIEAEAISKGARIHISPTRARARWRKFVNKLTGRRLVTERNNTVAHAARRADAVLGHDYLFLLEGSGYRTTAWSGARRRANSSESP